MITRRRIYRRYITIYNKVKSFLLSPQSKEFLIFLFFFFVSGSFWLLQTLNDDYEADITIPVKIKGIPDNTVLTSEPVSNINIKLKDKGVVLMNYMISSNFYPIAINFPDYIGYGNHVKIPSAEFEKTITRQLNASTKLLAIAPDTVDYIYATGKSKLIPVRFQGKVTSKREYYIPDTIVQPDSILVYAPTELLEKLHYAETEYINLENISDTTLVQANIKPVKGAKFIPPEVKVSFPVDIYTEKTIELPIIGINFPADKVLRTFPSKVSVTFQVGMGKFRTMNFDHLAIRISYEELINLNSDKYKVRLRSIPPGIRNVRFIPDEVDFLIEHINNNDANH